MPTTVTNTDSCRLIQDNSTCNALGRAAKCFGRRVCKTAVAIPYVLYHVFSLSTEAVCGAGGAVAGAVGGGTIKLAKAIGAKLGWCRQSTRPLSDYVIKGFHTGANVGWLPGQAIGVVGSLLTTVALLNPFSLVVVGTILSAEGVIDGIIAYQQIKKTGASSVEDESKNILRNIRHECRAMHDGLYGEKKF